mgnify:FL=1
MALLRLSKAVLTPLLCHSIICFNTGSARGCDERRLLYYSVFGCYSTAAAQTGPAQVIIPAAHLFRGQNGENGRYRAEIQVSALADEVDVYHFNLSHIREIFRKDTHITAICNLLSIIF